MKGKKSKFKPEEIKGILPDGTIVLKEGVRRIKRYYNPPIDSQLNIQQIAMENYIMVIDKMFGDDANIIESYD
jgi:hypothetical protein